MNDIAGMSRPTARRPIDQLLCADYQIVLTDVRMPSVDGLDLLKHVTANYDIYVKLADAGEPVRLTTNVAVDDFPAWSPDGRFIAFVRSGQAEPGFYVVPRWGGPESKVAAIPVFPTHVPPITVDWSPDAKLLVITDTSVHPPPVVLVSVDDGQKRPLTSPPATSYGDFAPAFSPDGRWVAFLRAQGVGVTKLHVLPMKSDLTPEAEPKILLPEGQTVGPDLPGAPTVRRSSTPARLGLVTGRFLQVSCGMSAYREPQSRSVY